MNQLSNKIQKSQWFDKSNRTDRFNSSYSTYVTNRTDQSNETNKTYKSNTTNSSYLVLFSIFLFFYFLFPLSVSAATLGKAPNNLGLVGYWSMNEGAGTKVGDSSGFGNSSTVTGATWTTGKLGKALSFDGNDLINAGTSENLNMTGDFSSSLWFKTSGQILNSWGSLVGRGTASYFINSPSKGWYLVARNISGTNYINFQYSGASAAQQVSWTGGADNTWHHAVVTRQGNLFSIYIDGVLKSSLTTAVGDMSTSGESFFIGRGRSTDYFIGSLDEVRIYNRALTATEVANLYKAGTAKMLKGPTLVQTGTCLIGGSTCTINITNTAGTLLWVGINDYANTVDGWVYSITDTKGNSYLTASPATDTGNVNAPQTIQTFYAVNVPAGANTITCSRGAHSGGSARCVVLEYSGLSNVSPLNGHQENSLTGTNYTSGNLTTTNSNDLLIGYFASRLDQSWSGLSWTSRFQNNIDFGVLVQDKLVSSKGTYSVSATASNSAAGVVAINAFKSASGSAKLNSSQNKTGGTLDSGLVGMWSFNGADMNWTTQTAGTAVDVSGNGHNGTITYMNLKTAQAIGKVNQALMFDGIDDLVTATLPNLPAISVSMWIKIPKIKPVERVFDRNAYNPIFRVFDDGSFQFIGSVFLQGTGTLNANQWYHIVVTGDSSGHKIYINGVLNSSDATAYTVTETQDLWIGGAVDKYFGLLDEFRIYNRALSATEVKQLYNMGK